ncbi:MAG TPA: M23 family metallopeptidase [Candidatus Binatia bacterium]|nr:M23 family metallopeptidase [Candidatus Binatia bacterium]
MMKARWAGLALLALAACARADAEPVIQNEVPGAVVAQPAPAAQPAPLAQVYWPVVTARADWNTISSQPDCVRLRCFEAPRPVSQLDNPRRRHAGIDLFANAGDAVIAIEDGTVIGFYPFLRARTGEMSYALLVAHDGYVANYGEVSENSMRVHDLEIGSAVRAGQRIATVSDTSMLHFETYAPGTTRNFSWGYHDQRPAPVVDPTPRLQSLALSGQRLTP